jgi:hypothetical protein
VLNRLSRPSEVTTLHCKKLQGITITAVLHRGGGLPHDRCVSPPDGSEAIRSYQRIGLRARIEAPGRESDLVGQYIRDHLPAPQGGDVRTVFCEPKLESGFPDAVVVYWAPSVAQNWSPLRAILSVADLRSYQWILSQGEPQLEQEELAAELPYTRQASQTIERLVSARLLLDGDDGLQVPPLASNFAVTRLVAIEAKVKEPSRGLLQAARNGWFASESYLLTERTPQSQVFTERARSMGVGLVSQDDDLAQAPLAAERRPLPVSYASWLFNEWVWRAARRPGPPS